MSEQDFDAEIAAVRAGVTALRLSEETRLQLETSMLGEFGLPGTYGVFIRSDTNVEDLPQFTGAGLNETLPNIIDPEKQFAGITRVWSSVLSPRALAWRANILANPAEIYASVLLMKSVASSKSGVLVTANLIDKSKEGLTASVAWGVGGAVAGESAESIVIKNNAIELVSEAKTPYQRALSEDGGVGWVPARAGPVLKPPEIEALRMLAAEVNIKYAAVFDENGQPRPWDIEFGFVDGELTLFQIRPLVEKATAQAGTLLAQLRPERKIRPVEAIEVVLSEVPLNEVPLTEVPITEKQR